MSMTRRVLILSAGAVASGCGEVSEVEQAEVDEQVMVSESAAALNIVLPSFCAAFNDDTANLQAGQSVWQGTGMCLNHRLDHAWASWYEVDVTFPSLNGAANLSACKAATVKITAREYVSGGWQIIATNTVHAKQTTGVCRATFSSFYHLSSGPDHPLSFNVVPTPIAADHVITSIIQPG